MFSLVDMNSFYCSCEEAFDPRLRGRPLVVLSNGDSNVVARNPAVKALGVKMGEPWHLIQHEPRLAQTEWRSSNYTLYGDMSRRVYQVLEGFADRISPYSIDEFFFIPDRDPARRDREARALRREIKRATKIPSCVGMGPTKTIAKLANRVAKKNPDLNGVCDLTDVVARREVYREWGVGEIWGIAGAGTEKLKRAGAETIAEFVALPADVVRKLLTVVGARTHAELNGVACIPMELAPATRKSVAVTRNFGRGIEEWWEMREAVAAYATSAAEKLRRNNLVAGGMVVFMHTNARSKGPQYGNQAAFRIEASADSFALIADAVRAAKRMWRDGFRYTKAGVMLVDLTAAPGQAQLLASRDPGRSAALMTAMDRINERYGRGTVRPGGTSPRPRWTTRHDRLSPCYTTRIADIVRARAV